MTPMIPYLRWALVRPDGTWALGPQTFENERIALEVRDRCYKPSDRVVAQRVQIAPVQKRKVKR